MTEDSDAFLLDAFTRPAGAPRPEWAFKDPSRVAEEMEQVPLFMTRMPESTSENVHLAALQSLLYEGTPEEVAGNFKEQGNEAYRDALAVANDKVRRGRLFKSAVNFYSGGLEQAAIGRELRVSLLLNRAAVNLACENYGLAKKDCVSVLELDAGNEKAHVRLVKAAIATRNIDDAEKHLNQLQSGAPEYDQLQAKFLSLKSSSTKRSRVEEAMEARGLTRLAGAEKCILSELPNASSLPSVHWDDGLCFPAVLFYPPYGTVDFIESWHEDVRLGQQLDIILDRPSSWDTGGLYKSGIEVFIRFVGGVARMPLDKSIRSLLGKEITCYEHGLLAFYVLPASHAALFASKFANCRDAEQ